MKPFYIILISIFFYSGISAQKSKHFYIIPQATILNGNQAVSAEFQLTGGIQKNNWGLGIGTALDHYKVRTVPLFADIRRYFGTAGSLFAYASAGVDIPWPLESQYSYNFLIGGETKSRFNTGLYSGVGIGYAFRGKNKDGFQLSMGYSMKSMAETRAEMIYRDFPPYIAETSYRKMSYTFNRVALSIGYKF